MAGLVLAIYVVVLRLFLTIATTARVLTVLEPSTLRSLRRTAGVAGLSPAMTASDFLHSRFRTSTSLNRSQ